MKLLYRIAADATVFLHFAYATFIVVGLLLILLGIVRRWEWIRSPKFRWVHLAMILIVVFESWLGITCPLTTLEKELRAKAGQTTYEGDFIGNAVHELLFFDFPPWVFAVIYSAFGLLVLLTFVLAPPRRRLARNEAQRWRLISAQDWDCHFRDGFLSREGPARDSLWVAAC